MYKLFFALLLTSLTAITEAQADSGKVRLGFITDLSGLASYWGKQAVLGLQLAQSDIQSRGGNLELVIGDHMFKPAAAVSETQKLLNIDRVDALWVEFAPTVVAASPVAVKAKKLFLGNSAATSVLKTNPYAFKAYLDFERGCRAIAQQWKSEGLTRVGIIKANSEFGELCFRGASSVFNNLVESSFDIGSSTAVQLLKMKNEGVQAIISPALEGDFLNLLKSMDQLHYRVPLGVCEPDSFTRTVIEKYSQGLDGTLSFGFPEISREFLEKFKAAFPDNNLVAVEAAAMAYVHAHQIFQAVNSCPSNDAKCTIGKMSKSPPDSTIGFIRWQDRVAVYEFPLKRWHEGKQEILKKEI